MTEYTDNLRHVAEPQAPSERKKAVSTMVEDHAALWFTEHLREFAHYGDHDDHQQAGIALAYAEFIDQKVRDEGRGHVRLYAHTELAAETLMDALYHHCPDVGDREDYPMATFRTLEEATAEAFAHFVDDEEAPETPPEPHVERIDGEKQVVFDSDEAHESYADMKMAESEAEYEAKIARKRGRAIDEGRI